MTNEVAKLRVNVLINKVNNLEKNLIYFEKQKVFVMLGIKSDFEDLEKLQIAMEKNLDSLTKVLGEIRYIKRMAEMELEICLN